MFVSPHVLKQRDPGGSTATEGSKKASGAVYYFFVSGRV